MPKIPFWIFIVIAIVYFTGVRIDTMDIDASQYAEISREMLKCGDFLHIYDRGLNYLDKPPFLFWVSALSMKIFGVNNFGYKLPSILFALWALYATYRLTKLLYGDITGRMAALVLATCQGMWLMTNDVRCDTILMSWTITAVWLIQEYITEKKLKHLLWGSAAIAFGMMTKGPIALMTPVFCFGTDWVLKRQWRNFLNPAYLLGIAVIGILLIPMSIGLYQQYDMHPDAMVNGQKGVSGLRFFYWSQSFGRITGESPWKNGVDITFLYSNMLWSYLPWVLLLTPALFVNFWQLFIQKFKLQPDQEWISTGGFLLTYLALGSSAYQLPHYIFIAFPLASIITARFIFQMVEEKRYRKLHAFMKPLITVVMAIILFVALVLLVYVFPSGFMVVTGWAVATAIWIFLASFRGMAGKVFLLAASGMIIVNIFLSNHVYTSLLRYQVGAQAGRYIHNKSLPHNQVVTMGVDDPLNCLQFYAQGTIAGIDAPTQLAGRKYVLTMDKGLNELKQNGMEYKVLHHGPFYKVSELTPDFLNPSTRSKVVKHFYLVEVK